MQEYENNNQLQNLINNNVEMPYSKEIISVFEVTIEYKNTKTKTTTQLTYHLDAAAAAARTCQPQEHGSYLP